jgi:hypothetical protein
MSYGTMDLAPLLYIGQGDRTVSSPSDLCVDFPIILLFLRGTLATLFKELSSGLEGLNAYIDNCEQTSHRFGLFS